MRHGDPVAHGMDAGGVAGIRGLLRGAVERGDVPGVSLLVGHRGEAVLREAWGWADVETRRPLRPDDLVWIGSGTAPISATCVVRLAERGALDLDRPIQFYLPEFRGARLRGGTAPSSLPTTRQLLAHASGLIATAPWAVFWEPSGAFDPNAPPPPQAVQDHRERSRALTHSLAEQARRTARYNLAAEPGSTFAYSGAAFSVAGRVAEVVAGAPFDELVGREVLAPLAMTRTTFFPPPDQLAAMPVTYAGGPDGLLPTSGASSPSGARRLVMPSGGLASTLDDCGAFLQMHLNGGVRDGARVLSERSAAEMRRCHTAGLTGIPSGHGYGLGWCIDRADPSGAPLAVSHGGPPGASLWIDLDRDLVGVLFTQMQPSVPTVRELTHQVQERVRDLVRPTLPSA